MIRIITDSTADFIKADARALDIDVVPLTVTFGDEHFEDGEDLPVETFYEMLENAPKLPTTSQPSPEKFLTHFEAAKENGDTVICITLSSFISGTYQSANIAKEVCGYENIYVIDSLAATLGLQILVRRGAALRNDGVCAEEIVAVLNEAKGKIAVYAVVDDLKYLRKGGRLSGAAAVAGGLLGIKPVVEVADGKVGVAGKARGLPGAYVTIFKLIEANGGIDENYPISLGYTGKRHGLEPFMRFVTQNLHMQKPLVSPIGAVIGTHAGPGACGIAYFRK